MLEFDTNRGPHSTGVVAVQFNHNVEFDKQLGTPWDFYNKSRMVDKDGSIKGHLRALIGHNRWATVGEITPENAHPFDFDQVVGVHNGTLTPNSLFEMEKEIGKFPVDSQSLYAMINKKGLKGAINSVRGAWSLAYWDKERKEINLFRNYQRPMHYAYSEDKKTVFFASEEWMILTACHLSGVKIHGVMTTQVERRYSCKLDNKANEPVDFVYDEEVISEKPYEVTYYRGGSVSNTPFGQVIGPIKSGGTISSSVPEIGKYTTGRYQFVSGKTSFHFDLKNGKVAFSKGLAEVYMESLTSDINVIVQLPNKEGAIDKTQELKSEDFFWETDFKNELVHEDKRTRAKYVIVNYKRLQKKKWSEFSTDVTSIEHTREEEGYVRLKGGKLITKTDWDHRTRNGCCLCGLYRDWETDRKSTRLNSSH